MNHLGFMRPKSVRIFLFKDFLGSRTYDAPPSRTKTTQCQFGLPFSICHFIASNARFGNESHLEKGISRPPVTILRLSRSRRIDPVSDHRSLSSAKIPIPLAIFRACLYDMPANVAAHAMAQPVASSWITGFKLQPVLKSVSSFIVNGDQ